MNRFLVLVGLIVFLLTCVVTLGCTANVGERAEDAPRSEASKFVSKLHYTKDPRTGLCFAYAWGGLSNGGPALAAVPCDKVSPALLE